MARIGRYKLPEHMAAITAEKDDTGKPLRAARTISRWVKEGPPKSLRGLFTSEAGRRLVRKWLEDYEDAQPRKLSA